MSAEAVSVGDDSEQDSDAGASLASSRSSSYAGSAASLMLNEELPGRDVVSQIEQAFTPLPLDRALAIQAQL